MVACECRRAIPPGAGHLAEFADTDTALPREAAAPIPPAAEAEVERGARRREIDLIKVRFP